MKKYYKKIKVMGDYCSSGLWAGRYGGMIELENLPSSLQQYKKRIKKWSNEWTSLYFSLDNYDCNNFSKIKSKNFYNSYRFKKNQKEQYYIANLIKKKTRGIEVFIFDDYLLFLNKKEFLFKI